MSELKTIERKEERVPLSDMINMQCLDPKYAYPAAKELVRLPDIFPVVKNLQLDRKSPEDQVKSLAAIIAVECCCNQVPLQLFCKGAWRPSSSQRVAYHSEYALQILNHIAAKNDLPKIVSFYQELILSDNELVFKLQPLYRILNVLNLMGKKNEAYIDKAIDTFLNGIEDPNDREYVEMFIDRSHIKNYSKCRFIKVHTKDIYAWKEEENKELLVMCGTYELSGVSGYLVDSDNKKFEYTYILSPMQTKVSVGNGSESAFAKNPVQFLKTKFMRHISVQYYKTCSSGSISILDLEDVSEDKDSVESDIQDRMHSIAGRIPVLPNWKEYDTNEPAYIEENDDGCNEGAN